MKTYLTCSICGNEVTYLGDHGDWNAVHDGWAVDRQEDVVICPKH